MSASKLQIPAVEAALLALLPARLAVSYGERVDVQTMGSGDFNDDGELTIKSPAVRLSFGSAQYGAARDNQRTTLSAELEFSAFCLHQSLRGAQKERAKTLALISTVQDELAGTRLEVGAGWFTEPILLLGVNQAVDVAGPIDQCYAVSFRVTGIVQFSGVNSNFGARA